MDQKSVKKENIVLYDGVCNLCNGTMQFLKKIDKKKFLTMIPSQSAEGQQHLKKFNLSSDSVNSIVFINKGKAYTKSTAVLRILKELKSSWSIFYAFVIIPRPLRDFFYGLVSTYRYKLFGKAETCAIPER